MKYLATIGRHKFIVSSLKDAEALLSILSEAVEVENDYIGEPGVDFKEVLYTLDARSDVEVKLCRHVPVTNEQFNTMRSDAIKARARRADAEKAA